MKKAVVEALEDIKAFDIEVIDVRKITTMTSLMVIASA
ncbi:MAG TPA: ribosome silencing factor, partial [Methylophilaceae bacterium]|nr:ribosome silencing factor [Methylophilaceae bacterium]HAP04197.1 ribosome silencing factor [Methylophilaceae bacterium]